MKISHIASAIVSLVLSATTISAVYAWTPEEQAAADAAAQAAAEAAAQAKAYAEQMQKQNQTANGGAGGSGGAGGKGGSVGDVSPSANSSSEGGKGGNASLSNTGNGGGAKVTSTTVNKVLSWTSVPVAELPAQMGDGWVKLTKYGTCGARAIIEPFKRSVRIPEFFGLWLSKQPVETRHGIRTGWNDKVPFEIKKWHINADPEAGIKEQWIVKVYGDQLYSTTGVDFVSGGAGSAANVASEKVIGAGVTSANSNAFGVVGDVAYPCEYEVHKGVLVGDAPPAADTPAPGNFVTQKEFVELTMVISTLAEKVARIGKAVPESSGKK